MQKTKVSPPKQMPRGAPAFQLVGDADLPGVGLFRKASTRRRWVYRMKWMIRHKSA